MSWFFYAYWGSGFLCFLATRWLFRRNGMKTSSLYMMWLGGGDLGALLMNLFLWPIALLIALVWWLGESMRQEAQRKKAAYSHTEVGSPAPYAGLTADELIARQKAALRDLESPPGR